MGVAKHEDRLGAWPGSGHSHGNARDLAWDDDKDHCASASRAGAWLEAWLGRGRGVARATHLLLAFHPTHVDVTGVGAPGQFLEQREW